MKRVIGFWGRGGAGKSTQIIKLVLKHWEETHKKIRWIAISDDTAKRYIDDLQLIERGIVDYFDVSSLYERAVSVQSMLADGYWYRYTKSGSRAIYKMTDCMTTDEEWKDIGGYVVEGGTGMSEWIKRQVSHNSGDKMGFNKPWEVKGEEGMTFGGVAQQHIGMIQDMVIDCIARMKSNLIENPRGAGPKCELLIWSFHDGQGEVGKKGSGEVELGPMLAGQAKTGAVQKYFDDLLHLCYVDTQENLIDPLSGQAVLGPVKSRLWCFFKKHNDPFTGLPCMANIRMLDKYIPLFEKKWPTNGLMMSYDKGVLELYEAIEKVTEFHRQSMIVGQSAMGIVGGVKG